jgi:RsiW-degrading membrane proteinase PrsW (M82 family)
MAERRDPVAEASKEGVDLYDVASWEERTSLDGLSVALYGLLRWGSRAFVVALALLILVVIGGLSALTDPQVGALTALSAIPALGLTAYVWYSDVTSSEPLGLLVATFLLAILTAGFAAVLNSFVQSATPSLDAFGVVGSAVGSALFFYVVVGPIEETVKLLAVRLWAYTSDSFGAVVDGAVYGAVAGLGFATIENALYITRQVDATGELGLGIIGVGGGITAVRALAGPGHVIYSAIAGYYLGLAKFNRENAGPIVVKGILLAAFVHGTYNTFVGTGSGLLAAVTPLGGFAAFIVFVVIYDGFWGYFLYRKLRRYRHAYRASRDDESTAAADDAGDVEETLEEQVEARTATVLDDEGEALSDASDDGDRGDDEGATLSDTSDGDDGATDEDESGEPSDDGATLDWIEDVGGDANGDDADDDARR